MRSDPSLKSDPRYLATVEQLLRSQAHRERGAANLFAAAAPLAPDERWRKVIAAHAIEERAHYAQVSILWATTFKRNVVELDAWVAARLAERPLPPVTTWLELAMALFLFDRAGRWQLSEYLASSFPPYRALAREIVDDERGHEDVGARMVVQLCTAPGADLAAAQAAFDRWLVVALFSFGRSGGDGNAFAIAAGLKTRDSAAVARDFLTDIAPTAKVAGLTIPANVVGAPGAPTRAHWDDIYGRKAPDQVSWFRPALDRSLELIDGLSLGPDAPIIDVGGGASTLVDDLLARGHTNVTVLDVSEKALAAARSRLGERAAQVHWLVADVREAALEASTYALWHDRAAFHFLIDDEERARYVATCRAAVRPGGHILVATFGPTGPERCSGLPVRRYGADELERALGPGLNRLAAVTETHVTPSGARQDFVYALFETPPAAAA